MPRVFIRVGLACGIRLGFEVRAGGVLGLLQSLANQGLESP